MTNLPKVSPAAEMMHTISRRASGEKELVVPCFATLA